MSNEYFHTDAIQYAVKQGAWNALVSVSEGILTDMIREAPIKTGLLRQMHGVEANPWTQTLAFIANTPYAAAVHDGARPHPITPTNAKALFWPGAAHPVSMVNHPGNRPNPWMTRVLDRDIEKIADFVIDGAIKVLAERL